MAGLLTPDNLFEETATLSFLARKDFSKIEHRLNNHTSDVKSSIPTIKFIRQTSHFSTHFTAMAPKQLNFITGNKNKLAEVQAILAPTGVDLSNQSVDLLEIQGTIEEISKDKCRRAADMVNIKTIEMQLWTLLMKVLSRSVAQSWWKTHACASMPSMNSQAHTCKTSTNCI